VSLGLPAEPENGGDLGEVPSDLDQTFSAVREAQTELIQSAAELGVIHSYNQTPKQMLDEFTRQSPQGNVDQIFARMVPGTPAVKQAKANIEAAQSDLAQAELNLRYCDVVADIDGVITRRNVNPGNNVLVGQSLMAIRSLDEIWVDANFKETQLRDLRIGQPVASMSTCTAGVTSFPAGSPVSPWALGRPWRCCRPQNATGNFVKVVQRLPVRIELQGYDPSKEPLFIGLSVTPYVYLNRPATGPDAGKVLQTSLPRSSTVARPQTAVTNK
jgi:membrane fusion protein (multidrug efflux system)